MSDQCTTVLIRDEAPADGMGLFEAARLVGYPMSLPNLHSQSCTCISEALFPSERMGVGPEFNLNKLSEH